MRGTERKGFCRCPRVRGVCPCAWRLRMHAYTPMQGSYGRGSYKYVYWNMQTPTAQLLLVRSHVHTNTHRRTHRKRHTHKARTWTHRYIHTHTHIRTLVYAHTHIHTYILTYIHTYGRICTYTHTYINTLVRTCIHAVMHTCVHTQKHAYKHVGVRPHTAHSRTLPLWPFLCLCVCLWVGGCS
jgi:hypothetical protein